MHIHTRLQATFLSTSSAAEEPKHPRLVNHQTDLEKPRPYGPWVDMLCLMEQSTCRNAMQQSKHHLLEK